MTALHGLKPGDPLVAVAGRTGLVFHTRVAHVARVWLTDSRGRRYRLADGRSGDAAYADEAMTPAEWDARQERRLLEERLREHGWVPELHGKTLTLSQLRRGAALLAEFESEGSGGLL